MVELLKYYTVFGLLSPITFTALWIAAALLEPSWVLGNNSLSDLGICGNPSAEVCFNMGCMLAGMFALIFDLGLLRKKGEFCAIGVIMFVGVIALAGVGVMNLNYGYAHQATATLYAICAYISMILSLIADIKGRKVFYWVVTAVLVFLCIGADIQFTFEGFEPIGISCTLIWVTTQAIKFMREEGIDGRKIVAEGVMTD